MILQKIKTLVHTRPESSIEESFAAHQKTSDEREAQELQYKLEAIRFVLESCLDEAGFQKEKLGFVSDMIRSMGLDWEKTLDRNWNGSVYAFRIFTRNCSTTLRKQLAAAGVELDKRYLMEYRYQENRLSADSIHRVYKMYPLNGIITKKIGE